MRILGASGGQSLIEPKRNLAKSPDRITGARISARDAQLLDVASFIHLAHRSGRPPDNTEDQVVDLGRLPELMDHLAGEATGIEANSRTWR